MIEIGDSRQRGPEARRARRYRPFVMRPRPDRSARASLAELGASRIESLPASVTEMSRVAEQLLDRIRAEIRGRLPLSETAVREYQVLYNLLKTLEECGAVIKEQLPSGATGYRRTDAVASR